MKNAQAGTDGAVFGDLVCILIILVIIFLITIVVIIVVIMVVIIILIMVVMIIVKGITYLIGIPDICYFLHLGYILCTAKL